MRPHKATIESKRISYEETVTDLNRTKVETTFINTDFDDTIERRENLLNMKGIDFMQEAQEYGKVIDDLK